MKLVFLPEASQDIDRLYNFLIEEAKNPLAAQKAMLALDEGIQMLLESPRMGIEMAHNPEYRELYIPFGKRAYVLRHRIDTENDALVVVRVWHSRESRN